jgi:sugar (pentulose or hexulose) kinase
VCTGLHSTIRDAFDAFVSYRPESHDPDPGTAAAYDEAYSRYRAVYAALRPVFGT